MDQPRTARPAAVQHQAHQVTVSNNGQELGRQLDTIIKPTTVEDLARKGGPIKAVKERDLRELINRSLLTLLESSTSISGAEQERILDKVQAELRRSMGAHAAEKAEQQRTLAENQALNNRLLQLEGEHAERAGEVGDLRAQLSDAGQQIAGLRAELELQRATAASPTDPDRWAKAIDDQWFASRHRRDASRHGTDQGETLAEALAAHLAGCAQLLTDYPSTPPGIDPAGDVVARIKTLLALRVQDQTWIAELQKRQAALMGERDGLRAERDEARGALDAELQRSIEAEERAEALEARLAELPHEQQMLAAPPAALEDELADLRDRVQESQSRLDDALAARTRAERELAGAATGRAAAEARLADADARLEEAVGRVRVLEGQLGDQRRTTDLARLASVEAETLRAEVEGLRRLLHEREQVLAQEREKSHADREKHRADNSTRLDSMRRVESALVTLREQLSTAERLLVERTAEVEALRAATPEVRTEIVTIDRAVEVAEMAGQLAAARASLSAAAVERTDAERSRRVAEAETAALRAHQASAAHIAQERDLLRRALAEAEARAEALAARPAHRPAAAAVVSAAPVASDAGAEARLDELRTVLARAERNRNEAESARRLAEAELAALRAHQADAVALTRERDWLREALLARNPAPVPTPTPATPAVPSSAPAAPMPAAVATAASVPSAAAPVAATPASTASVKAAPAAEPVRRAGIACLGEDGRVRFAYVRGTTPRLVVHGATWHHQGLAVTSAAPGAVPVLLVAGSGVTALYRDRNGAVQRAGIEGRETVLGDGSADGEPAVLPDPVNGRWLLATRRGNRVTVHAVGAEGPRAIGEVAAAGDPAWIAGNKHAPARLAVPNGNGVSLHGCGEGLPQSGTLPFAAPVEALAVAGIGNDAVIAVRDSSGVVSARTGRRDGTWSDAAVLDASGAPAVGRIAAAAHDGEIVVAYRASDGVLQLMLHRDAWRHLAFGDNFRAPAAAGDPALVLHDNLIRCFYQGGDGHVHEVRNSTAGWNAYDLSVLTRDL